MSDYNFRIRHTEPDDQAMARRIAKRLVQNAKGSRARNLHFSVLSHSPPIDMEGRTFEEVTKSGREARRQPPPFPFHWKHKNIFGVTFGRDQIDEAGAWVRTALLAGYSVFWSRTKRVPGFGHGLENGDYDEDIEEAERAGTIPRKAR